MKRLLLFLVCMTLQVTLLAEDSKPAAEAGTVADSQTATTAKPAANQDRLFFPKDWYWGWAQFDIAPPHNEIDPNLCAANAGAPQYGGKDAPCSAFARYLISGNVEIRPIGRTIAKRLMLFYEPNFLFGKNLPQTLYTWSWSGIGMEFKWGVGIDLPKRFEFRFTTHPKLVRFGSRDQPLGPAWLGPDGPWGQYNTFGIRKYFGARREGTY